MKVNPPNGKTLGSAHCCSLFFGRRTDVQLYTDSWVVASGLAGWIKYLCGQTYLSHPKL